MAKVFSITIPKNEIVLDAGRKATATYSVTNISDQVQKGQAVVRPKQPETAAWFSVKEPGREFPAGRSAEVTVQISVPPAAVKGTYEFELDIVRDGVEPLEDRTDQGQSATFEVKEIPPRPFPWWIVAVGAVVLILIIAIVLILSNRPAAVPNLLEMDPTRAARAISDAGLVVGTVRSEYNKDTGAGLVAFSSPAAKTELPRGGSVDLVLSNGRPAVPNLAGMTKAQASAALEAAGLKLGITAEVTSSSVPAGQVISSNPPAGQALDPGSEVGLTVSKGPATPTVTPTPTRTLPPAVVSKTIDRAPSEDTYAPPASYICLVIKPWIIPAPMLPKLVNPVSYKQRPALRITLPATIPIQKMTMVPFLVATSPVLVLPNKCADSKSPEMELENTVSGSQFFPGVAMMRFDFGTDIPAGAAFTKANLKLYVPGFGSGTTSMKVYVAAATNNWQVGGTSPVCSAEHSTTLTINSAGTHNFDLTPLLAKYGADIVKNGLCLQSETVGLIRFVSSEGGVATQRPLLSLTYTK